MKSLQKYITERFIKNNVKPTVIDAISYLLYHVNEDKYNSKKELEIIKNFIDKYCNGNKLYIYIGDASFNFFRMYSRVSEKTILNNFKQSNIEIINSDKVKIFYDTQVDLLSEDVCPVVYSDKLDVYIRINEDDKILSYWRKNCGRILISPILYE